MAMTLDQVRGLSQLRQRLSQLSTSMGTLRVELERSEPLPTWPALQSSASLLSFNLQQLSETFASHRQFLRETHAYPLPAFPGHAQEALLTQLLRKKLEPGVEHWIEEYTNSSQGGQGVNGVANGHDGGGLSNWDLTGLWSSAASASNGIVGAMLEEDGEFADDSRLPSGRAEWGM